MGVGFSSCSKTAGVRPVPGPEPSPRADPQFHLRAFRALLETRLRGSPPEGHAALHPMFGMRDLMEIVNGYALPPADELLACFDASTSTFKGENLQGGPLHKLFLGMTAPELSAMDDAIHEKHGVNIFVLSTPTLGRPQDAHKFLQAASKAGIGQVFELRAAADYQGKMTLDVHEHARLERMTVLAPHLQRRLVVIKARGVQVTIKGDPGGRYEVYSKGERYVDPVLARAYAPRSERSVFLQLGGRDSTAALRAMHRDESTFEHRLAWAPASPPNSWGKHPEHLVAAFVRYAQECGGTLTVVEIDHRQVRGIAPLLSLEAPDLRDLVVNCNQLPAPGVCDLTGLRPGQVLHLRGAYADQVETRTMPGVAVYINGADAHR